MAVSALSWILVNITHEIVGHAGFGMLTGLKLYAVNTTTAYLDKMLDFHHPAPGEPPVTGCGLGTEEIAKRGRIRS